MAQNCMKFVSRMTWASSIIDMLKITLILWIIRAGELGRALRQLEFSPVLQVKYILSDAERERDTEIEDEEYIRWKGSYICRNADLGNRIAASSLPDKRYILIERRTK